MGARKLIDCALLLCTFRDYDFKPGCIIARLFSRRKMMKKSVMTCILVLLVCLGLTSVAQAILVTGSDEWEVTLGLGEPLTTIAHYVWGGVVFTAVPEQTDTHTAGGDWDLIGWQAELSPDNTIAYIYGPTITGGPDPYLFSYEIFYQWDDMAVGFDSNYPVYTDTAVYDGPYGSEPTNYWGVRFTPGDSDPDSWDWRADPYYKDEPGYEEGFYDNPAPEPMTICLLGLGTALLRKKRKRKALSLSNKEDSHPLC